MLEATPPVQLSSQTAAKAVRALTAWVEDGPNRSGFSVVGDALVADVVAADEGLRGSEEHLACTPRPERKRLRGRVDEALSVGLNRRAEERVAQIYPAWFDFENPAHGRAPTPELCELGGYHLTEDELRVFRWLVRLAVAGTLRRPDNHGIRGVRVCGTCAVVFRGAHARQCPPCRRAHPRSIETPEALAKRRRMTGLEERRAWNLVENTLTVIGEPAPPGRDGRCDHCGEPFALTRPDRRYCSDAHRAAAHRAKPARH